MRPDRVLTGMLAFSAIFGLVTGMYFVGRSSQFQLMLLFPAWGLCAGAGRLDRGPFPEGGRRIASGCAGSWFPASLRWSASG